MENYIKVKLNVYANKDGRNNVYIRVRLVDVKQYVQLPTSVYVESCYWSADKQQVVKHRRAKEMNAEIDKAKGVVAEIIVRYRQSNRVLSRALILEEFTHPKDFTEFISFVRKEAKIRYELGDISEDTWNNHSMQMDKLSEFRSEILFGEIDSSFLDSYRKFLVQNRKNHVNTVAASLRTIKAYIRIAKAKGITDKNAFEGYKIKTKRTPPKTLDVEEYRLLISHYWSLVDGGKKDSRHGKVLRHFLFACNTGFHIAEFQSLELSNVVTIGGRKVLSLERFKTHVDFCVPLNDFAMKLIEHEADIRKGKRLFMCITDQRMNLYIKEVCAVAGIADYKAKEVSFAWARHTFASISLAAGMPVTAVSKLLAHSSASVTLDFYAHFIKGNDDAVVKQMNDISVMEKKI